MPLIVTFRRIGEKSASVFLKRVKKLDIEKLLKPQNDTLAD